MTASTKGSKKAAAPAIKFMELAVLNKEIDSIGKASHSIDKRVQAAGLSALHLLQKDGDIGPVNRLILALSKGTRRSSLSQWFLNHGALMLNTDDATKAEKPFVYSKARATDLVAAAEQHWTDAQKPRDISDVYDVRGALAKILKHAMKPTTKLSAEDKKLVESLALIAPTDVQAKAGV